MKKYENLLKIYGEQVTYIPFHLSENLRLLYVLSGSISCRWVAGEHTLTAGQIEIVNIGEPFCIERCSEDNLILFFEIEKDKAVEYCDLIDDGLYNCNTTLFYDSTTDLKAQEKLKEKLQMLYCSCMEGESRAEVERRLCDIVNFIADNCHDLLNMLNAKRGMDPRAERFLRIYTYMYNHCDEKINLKQLADCEYVSQQYLSKEFNERLNVNFKDTLEYYRIIQSVRYLIQGQKNVTMISELCGFSAPRYFYKHFGIYLKCTPAEFRSRYLSRREQVKEIEPGDSGVMELLLKLQRVKEDGAKSRESMPQGQSEKPFAEQKHLQFNKRKVSRDLVVVLMEFARKHLPEGVEVMKISGTSARSQMAELLACSTPPVILVFYTRKGSCDDSRAFARKVGEAGIGAHLMSQLAESNGLCCHLDFELLFYEKEICRILGIDKNFQPLLAAMTGYCV